jgi:hypothetical protein
MLRSVIAILFISCWFNSFAQYDFEKYPAIKYARYKKWKLIQADDEKIAYSLTFKDFFKNHDALTLKYVFEQNGDSSILSLYRNKKYIQKFIAPGFDMSFMDTVDMDDSVRIADINGDSLNDIKIFIPNNMRCGAYNDYAHVIYLFQKPNGRFNNIMFYDAFYGNSDDIINRPERDFDGDGNYEIITETFTGVGDHNYWSFNIYNYRDGKLVNVNEKAGYPLMYQLLYRMNYSVTNRIKRDRMKLFSLKQPDECFIQK